MHIEKTELADWEGLHFTLYMDTALAADQIQRLESLISSWYLTGFYSGFGGKLHRLETIEAGTDTYGFYLQWSVDMGTASREALDAIVRCLDQFALDQGLRFYKLVLGDQYIE